ncbi:MAG: tetratricopeptide repeat protein [Firmicutes bacterium]|nr:tetratricopeptide repeat protein [Bacillota bacterium]
MDAKEIAAGFKKINEMAMKAMGAGEYKEAIAIFMEGLALEEKLGLDVPMAESYANIGNVYLSAGELEEAQNHLVKAQKIFQKASKTENFIATSLTIAAIMEEKGDDTGAQKQLDSALRLARNGEQRGSILFRVACLNQKIKNNYKAQEAYGRALMEMERLNRKSDVLLCLLARASLFLQMDRQMLASRDIARAKSLTLGNEILQEQYVNALAELGLEG